MRNFDGTLTPTDVKRLLDEHGLAPRKRAGQNFVVDPNTVRRIVAAANLAAHDTVVEIGPGLGSLTLVLAQAAKRVVAIEVDAGFIPVLTDHFGADTHVQIAHADALEVDLAELTDNRPARLVANLPYNVATPLLFHALDSPAIVDAFVMVQREVGERWGAQVGDHDYAGVSLKLACVANVEVALAIPRNVFYPVPNVDSVMVRVTRRPDAPDAETVNELFALADAAFAQRRKTLRNTLRAIGPPEVLADAAAAAKIDLSWRAERLGSDDLVRLHAQLRERGLYKT